MDESIAKFVRRGMSYKDAFFKTKEQIALTGASEHHTGLAVDIVGKNHQSLDESRRRTRRRQNGWRSTRRNMDLSCAIPRTRKRSR